MMTATETLKQARQLLTYISEAHPAVSLRTAYKMARVAQVVAEKLLDKAAADKRLDREKAGMIANYVQDLRAVGHWDGE